MLLSDNHVNLSGFLEGNSNLPLRWHQVPLETEPSAKEWEAIQHFQRRAREFLANIDDMDAKRVHSMSLNRGKLRATARTSGYPGRFRVKSLYLDFRHLLADKEPGQVNRVVNALCRRIDKAEPIQDFLKDIKKRFLIDQGAPIKLGELELRFDALIDLWFNTEFFHAGYPDQLRERQQWHDVLEDEAAHHLIFWAVVPSAHSIKCLYACAKDLKPEGQGTVNCPDVRIIRLTNLSRPPDVGLLA